MARRLAVPLRPAVAPSEPRTASGAPDRRHHGLRFSGASSAS